MNEQLSQLSAGHACVLEYLKSGATGTPAEISVATAVPISTVRAGLHKLGPLGVCVVNLRHCARNPTHTAQVWGYLDPATPIERRGIVEQAIERRGPLELWMGRRPTSGPLDGAAL